MNGRIPLRNRRGEVLAWALVDPSDVEAVSVCRWSLNNNGYAQGYPRRVQTSMHRFLLGLTPGDGLQGDHINGDPLDNRRENLRVVTPAQNQQNTRSRRGSTSRYRGVSWSTGRGKWRAEFKLNGKSRHIGLFLTEEEAAFAAATVRAEVFSHVNEARPGGFIPLAAQPQSRTPGRASGSLAQHEMEFRNA